MKRVCARTFWWSFLLTVLVVLFCLAVLTVDARCRWMSFRDSAPPFSVSYTPDGRAELTVHAFSLKKTADVTGWVKLVHFIADFFCIHHEPFPAPQAETKN